MATDKKDNQETTIKPVDPASEKNAPCETVKKVVKAEKVEPVKFEGKSTQELEALKNGGAVDPVVEEASKLEEKKEVDPIPGKVKEGLQSRKLTATVVVAPTTNQAELNRIAEVVRIAYEGKGSFSDDVSLDLEQSLIGKSDEEIIEIVKPYFIFTDASQSEKPAKIKPEVQEDITQVAGIIGAIAEYSQIKEDNTKAKELMEAQNLNEIWRCPDSGYWFSRKDYTEEYERKNKCSLQHYKK